MNPDQLRKIATAHGDRWFPNYNDPEKRERGTSYKYSWHFTTWGEVNKNPVRTFEFQLGNDPNYRHHVNFVPTSEGPHIVDFTYNKFDPTAQMPLVEPLETYEKRFRDQGIQITRLSKRYLYNERPYR